MYFAFTDEQAALRDSAARYLRERAGSERVRALMATERGWDEAEWARVCGELGWAAMTVPERYDGFGLGDVELAAVLEPMGRALWCSPFFGTVCMAVPALLEAGESEAAATWLPRIAAGEATAALAFASSAGADAVVHQRPTCLGVTAERTDAGWRIKGQARQVVDGHSATVLVVAAQLQSRAVLLAVPAEQVRAQAHGTMDATRRLATVDVDLELPDAAVLAGPDDGMRVLRRALDRARIALACEQVGGAAACLDAAVDYAKQRVQFGRPIGTFQAIKHKCADMMLRVESARSAAWHGAAVAAAGRPDDELAEAASIAASYAGEAYVHCAGESIQIHGGIGFTWEHDAHLYFKRARASEGLLGTPRAHREAVARTLLR